MRYVLLFVFLICSLHAREPYHALVTVEDQSARVSAPNLVDLKRDLSGSSIQDLIPIYTPTSPVSMNLNLRGIDAILSFAANSTFLQLEIPEANISTVFEGATRDESIALMKESIRDGGQNHRLLRAYARFSPIDPIAGNPLSLMAAMSQSDYLLGYNFPLQGCCCDPRGRHRFKGGAEFTRGFSDGFETSLATLPLQYGYSRCGSRELIIDLPVSYMKSGGSSSVFSSFGVAVKAPLTCRWSLTPAVRFGAGGTLDLCTSGSFLSAGVTSTYVIPISDFALSILNYASYISSTNLWLTGINFNYNLHNYVFKNGFVLTKCSGFEVCGRRVSGGVSFEDSYFARERLYMHHWDEVGLFFVVQGVNPCLCWDALQGKVSYLWGERGYHGCAVGAEYFF